MPDISGWSTTAASNTSIDTINIAEFCPYANLNDMGRAIMANIRGEFMDMAATVTAATITNISGQGQFQPMSGNTTIDSFATAVTGMLRDIRVLGTPLVKHSSALSMPGSANRTMAAGDMLHLRSLGAGNWVAEVTPKDGKAIDVNDNAYADLASATITDLGAQSSRYLNITGAVTIDSFATIDAGRVKYLKFASTPVIKHNGTSLIIPGAANITAAAGDKAKAVSLGSGNWEVFDYIKASGEAITAGKLINRYYASYATNADATTVLPVDDTIPASTEGTEYASLSITTTTATQRVRLRASGMISHLSNIEAAIAIFRDTTCIQASKEHFTSGQGAATSTGPFELEVEDAPGAAATYTYSVRFGPGSAGTVRLNGTLTSRLFGGAASCTFVGELIEP